MKKCGSLKNRRSNKFSKDYFLESINPCPKAGEGIHSWTLHTALFLIGNGFSKDEAFNAIWERTQRHSSSEILAAVQAAARFLDSPCSDCFPKLYQKWPTRNEEAIKDIIHSNDSYDLCDLEEVSPIRITDESPYSILKLLFKDEELISAATQGYQCSTRPLNDWRNSINRCSQVVPNPMSKPSGRTQGGKESTRCTDNSCIHRRYLVIEFDLGTLEEQATIIAHLASMAPLVMVVYSGEKSLHAWFFAEDKSEIIQRKFFEYAVSLGADPQIWTKCQLVRVPQAIRPNNGKRQSVYYLNPKELS